MKKLDKLENKSEILNLIEPDLILETASIMLDGELRLSKGRGEFSKVLSKSSDLTVMVLTINHKVYINSERSLYYLTHLGKATLSISKNKLKKAYRAIYNFKNNKTPKNAFKVLSILFNNSVYVDVIGGEVLLKNSLGCKYIKSGPVEIMSVGGVSGELNKTKARAKELKKQIESLEWEIKQRKYHLNCLKSDLKKLV